MSVHQAWDQDGRLRVRRDDTARVVTVWDEAGEMVEERPYTAQEAEAAEAVAAVSTRTLTRDTLVQRVAAAQATNRQIAGAASFTNTQRDDALRFLARQQIAQNRVLLHLLGQVDALDSPD